MTKKQKKTYFFDKAENVKRVLYAFYAVCIALIAAEFIVKRNTYHEWENIPAFYPLFGFAACVILVFLASKMRRFVSRDEHYYDRSKKRKEK